MSLKADAKVQTFSKTPNFLYNNFSEKMKVFGFVDKIKNKTELYIIIYYIRSQNLVSSLSLIDKPITILSEPQVPTKKSNLQK